MAGLVTRCANSVLQQGTVSPAIVWQLEPPPTVETFLQRYPEARKVIEIVADASVGSPSVVTEPQPNATTFVINVVTIATANTPVNLPNIVVPDGRALVVVSTASNDVKKQVYIADSSANALLASSRITLTPGNSIKLFVDNANKVWVNSNQNNQKVDVIVEQ